MADVKLSYSGDKIDELLRKAEIHEAEINGGEIKLKVSDMEAGSYNWINNPQPGDNIIYTEDNCYLKSVATTSSNYWRIKNPIWLNKNATINFFSQTNFDVSNFSFYLRYITKNGGQSSPGTVDDVSDVQNNLPAGMYWLSIGKSSNVIFDQALLNNITITNTPLHYNF